MANSTLTSPPNASPTNESPTIATPAPPFNAQVSLIQNNTASESPPISSPSIDPPPQSPLPSIPPPTPQSQPPPVPVPVPVTVPTLPVPVPSSQPTTIPPPVSPPPPVAPLVTNSPVPVHESPPLPLPSQVPVHHPPPVISSPIIASEQQQPPPLPAQQVVPVPVFVPVFVPTPNPPTSSSLLPPTTSNPVLSPPRSPTIQSPQLPAVQTPRTPSVQNGESPSVQTSFISGSVTERDGLSRNTVIGLSVGLGVLGIFVLIGLICIFKKCKKKRHVGANFPGRYSVTQNAPSVAVVPDNSYQMGTVSYQQLCDITEGFSVANLIGEGGFARVYKGLSHEMGREVAVKQIKVEKNKGIQGEKDFRLELEIIGRIHHRHLVELLGYCLTDVHRLLIYEFVPNKTLDYHLHGGVRVLEWRNRVKIAIGSAKGLAYLHEDCQPKIVHRDIKSANILLDNSFEAKVADFGLAKFTNDNNTHVSTRVVGTFGYMAPEYASSGKLSDKSDVFSFGVVLLELITGRKPINMADPDESLVEWARPLLIEALETEDFGRIADPELEGNYIKSEMLKMVNAAAACVRHSAVKRPRMVQIMRALDRGARLSDLSNGVKFGESTVYDSRQYSLEIERLNKMPLQSDHNDHDYS